MLGVVKHLAPGRLTKRDRVADHPQILFQGRVEHVRDVQVPSLADNGNDRRLRVEQGFDIGAYH